MNMTIELLNRARLFWRTMSVAFVCALFFCEAQAQVGEDSLDGVAGIFSGIVTTGGGYNPYTMNATRSITDLSLYSLSKYGLSFTRTYNSRNLAPSTQGAFGNVGWTHSFSWVMTVDPADSSKYDVYFPDGRAIVFYNTGVPYQAGLQERIDVSAINTTHLVYVLLADGGKVEFQATSYQGSYFFVFSGLIDPYGLRTSVTGNPVALTQTITDPGGRSLTISYQLQYDCSNTSIYLVSRVDASDGRSVDYHYTLVGGQNRSPCYYVLDHAYYNFGTQHEWTAHYTYEPAAGDNSLPWRLIGADDPMYAGPVRKIAYEYPTGPNNDGSNPVYGQIHRERKWDGTAGDEPYGQVLSKIETGVQGAHSRIETRSDNLTRTFVYANPNGKGFLVSATDFMGHNTSQFYDANAFVNAITDANQHSTNLTRSNPVGKVTQVLFPASSALTTPAPRGHVDYTYGGPSCTGDPNNQDDARGRYFVCKETDEAGNITQFLRDTNKRVVRINYADGGYETFTYNSLGQVTEHQLKTGGVESFYYDSLHRLQYYSDPYHYPASPSNYSAYYGYDSLDRVIGMYDAGHNPYNWTYNDRGQVLVTTFPAPGPSPSPRPFTTNAYNDDGTLQSTTNQLGKIWSYTYDDYRRVTSVTRPQHGANDTSRTTNVYYFTNVASDAYRYTDSNVTLTTLPSGKQTKTVYDPDRRVSTVTLALGTADETRSASYSYDYVGNLVGVFDPYNNYETYLYDERNRPMTVQDRLQRHSLEIRYDSQGHKAKATRLNGQTIIYTNFDAGNRPGQKTVTQLPEPDAVTVFTYYGPNVGQPVGFLKSMKDPRQVATSSSESYGFTYDSMGRKLTATYPRVNASPSPTESWHYDTMGRVDQFTNRAGKHLTPVYDARNQVTHTSWDDNLTPAIDYVYDAASRLQSISNVNSTVTRAYFDDNLLQSETQVIGSLASKTVNYTYDADANRASIQYPGSSNYLFQYAYTNRNQLLKIGVDLNYPHASYSYDLKGNLQTRHLANNTDTSYTVDALDRVTNITHSLNGTTRTLDYGYESFGNNRTWTKRDGGNGDVFGYDLNDQTTAVQLNIANPDTTPVGPQSIIYDAGGNRVWNAPYYPAEQYATNDLNQYGSRTIYYSGGQQTINATYDSKGNVTSSLDSSSYTFDAANRILSASKNGATTSFTYDGLGRQVTRITSGGLGAVTTFNIYDGWNLIEERKADGSIQAQYFYGADGLFLSDVTGRSPYWTYYYRNGEGSISHVADTNGTLVEAYRYDLQGTPVFLDASGRLLSGSKLSIRHLFTGEQWYSELGLYDLRNRFYSPDSGRFIQPDPIGFSGGDNLYRHCGNSPVNGTDPFGTDDFSANIADAISNAPVTGPASFDYSYYTITDNFSINAGTSVGTTTFGDGSTEALSNAMANTPITGPVSDDYADVRQTQLSVDGGNDLGFGESIVEMGDKEIFASEHPNTAAVLDMITFAAQFSEVGGIGSEGARVSASLESFIAGGRPALEFGTLSKDTMFITGVMGRGRLLAIQGIPDIKSIAGALEHRQMAMKALDLEFSLPMERALQQNVDIEGFFISRLEPGKFRGSALQYMKLPSAENQSLIQLEIYARVPGYW
jgi:RHS repeat-associated protein